MPAIIIITAIIIFNIIFSEHKKLHAEISLNQNQEFVLPSITYVLYTI